jgi:hypothetical protein
MTTDVCNDNQPYDRRVSIFVPSRYGSGQPITPGDRDNQIRCVAGVLARAFGGATAEEIAHRSQRVLGTFQHKVDTSERFVDEGVQRVWAGATKTHVNAPATLNAVTEEACRLARALGQECVLYEWDREIRFTPSQESHPHHVRFSDFDRQQQEEFALMAWHRVEDPESLCGVLSLAGWQYPKEPADRNSARPKAARIAWTGDTDLRTAWEWLETVAPGDEEIEQFIPGDLLVMKAADARLKVWLRTKEGYAGPREFPLATETRPAARISIEFAIALLGGDCRFSLQELLDAEGVTSRFYREIRDQIDAATTAASKSQLMSPSGFAQRLLGRLLFLRFIEEKEWLPRNSLRDGWKTHCKDYYRSFLLPLFRDLDTSGKKRADGLDVIPYLNGGLFAVTTEEESATVPDALFDPGVKRRTILNLLYRYHFTLDERAGREQQVSINPEMFGRVLESLSPGEERKKKGVHYTPAPVATALAVGGIVSRLERRAKDRGLVGVTQAALQRVWAGDRTALPAHVAEQLLDELRDLKILDPAVGSGSLLVACLEVLLAIEGGLKKTIGEDLRKGSRSWAKSARHYITECLYGVDIAADAVEVARLRLWLFLAVGESSPAALPDLGYNLRVGNTLGHDAVEERLLQAIEDRQGNTKPLQFTQLDRAIDIALEARAAFRRAQGQPAQELKKTFQALEKAEQELRTVLGAAADADRAPPFGWAVHFGEVFGGSNQGFDVVIANPPYVRSATLSGEQRDDLDGLYRSWRGNRDLYFPFIERCLTTPVLEDQVDSSSRPVWGLAGRAGSIAFIMPNFANTKSAETLRELIAEGGHVDMFVDFVDHQVFPTASNYVALLFATAERRKRKTFDAKVVTAAAFARLAAGEPWLDNLDTRSIHYRAGGWPIRSGNRASPTNAVLLGTIADVKTGIQTSWDDFYLCREIGDAEDPANVVVNNAFGEMVIERAMLFACAKGSKEIKGDQFVDGQRVIWPYDKSGEVLTEETLRSRFPLAWECFWKQRKQLKAREKGKFDGPLWWRFRRPQGVDSARRPKLLVPSIMPMASAYHDRAGQVICTASGSGGGGGWTIRLRDDTRMSYDQLAKFLVSDDFWAWLLDNGSPWRGGWRGVDRKILQKVPVPLG